jgi:hypothetical protein
MSRFAERLQADIDHFRDRVKTDPVGVLDPEGVIHHEFVSGNHGYKLDFDKVERHTDMYIEWVSVYARAVKALYTRRHPDALIGIANGANRLAEDVGYLLGITGLTTEKLDAKTVQLDSHALEVIEENNVRFALTIEDVGTTGGTTATAVTDLRDVGVRRIESVNFWQRNPRLARLEALRIPHAAVILEPLPMFSPDECGEVGYCADNIPLVEHAK